MIRFTSLGSGSRGNALVVESCNTRILLDCGFSSREVRRRLSLRGLEASELCAIVITHEHSDHIAGAFKLAAQFDLPVYLTRGCYAGVLTEIQNLSDRLNIKFIEHCEAFEIESLHLAPFSVPHDAREPVQYVFSDGAVHLGVLTDIGHATPHIIDNLSVCDALVLECNHQADLLAASAYPTFLKERISGDYGHLENRQAAQILSAIKTHKLRHIIAAHLSEKNNTPDYAASTLAEVLNCKKDWIGIADQALGFDWREI